MAVQVADVSFARFVYPFVFKGSADASSLQAIVHRLKAAGWVAGAFPKATCCPMCAII
jgi:hypothetical protein